MISVTENIRQCTRCLYNSLHPFGLTFDLNGVCSGCRVHDEKDYLDWDERFLLLKNLTEYYKLKNSRNYDCIVPITGGQDSFFTVHIVVNKLGLNPLLVNFNRNFNSAEGIKNIAMLRTKFSVDFRQFSINPIIARKIVKTTLANLGTVNWLWIAGQTSFPVRVASELGIPLIIWGAHQGIEQVGMYSYLDEVEMTSRYRREHDLMGVDEKTIFQFDPDFNEKDITALSYPDDDLILKCDIKGIYLNNYIRWDSVAQHEFVSKEYGYIGKKSSRTYYKYDNPDCPVYGEFQDFLKWLKLGYGKVTDQAVRDIRHKRISKSGAIKQIKKFEKNLPKDVDKFANWLGIPSSNLLLTVLKNSTNFANQIFEDSWKERFVSTSKYSLKPSFLSKSLIDKDYINFGKGI